ncbi:MAG: putative porin [Steroidobacteraceae bacterium]|nr:putative porin [Steroidobacteraceae bacterium]
MRNTLLAAAVAATLAMASVDASAATGGTASKAEIQAMQAQMQALADRLNKLEAANNALQTENNQLKAVSEQRDSEIDYLKEQTKTLRQESAEASGQLSKVKGADWASRIKFKGDFRVREEYIEKQRVTGSAPTTTTPSTLSVDDAANQVRTRFRFRLGAEAKVTDNSKVVFQIASGDGDPRSTNQTFTQESSEKGVYITQAYADWKFMDGANLLLGKQPLPFWRPGQSMFWDGDVNPEAVAVTFNRGMFFGSGYAWMVQENSNSNPSNVNVDPTIFGTQLGLVFPLFGGETKVAAQYYNLTNGKGNAPFYNGNAFGNTTYKRNLNGSSTASNVLMYDYEILELSGQMGMTVANLPLSFWVDWSQNMASGVEYDTAWAVGATLGKASGAKTWEAGLFYESMDKDAMFAQFIDSDFGGGVTDVDGWVFKAGYAPVKNVTVNATYFLNTTNKDVYAVSGDVPSGPYAGPYGVGKGMDYNRLQLDVNYKF